MSIDSLDIVKKLIAGTENGEVEFKETTGQLERGMETLCAFLNGTGGTALFGVTDKGKITGQEVADSTKRNIAEAINRLEPAAAVQVSYIPLSDSGKKIVALHVEESWLDRPFSYKGRAYMRVESVTTAMPQSVYNKLLLQREGIKHNWEAYPNYSLKLSDLDDDEIMKTVRLGIEQGRLPETTGNDITAILEKFGLLEDNVLNHAAAVLFAKKKLMDYPQCLLRLARFKGTDKTVFMDNRRIHGNLFQLLDAAMAFIFKHLSLSATTDTLEREEHLTVPYKAIREGVINSLCHRSYRAAGGSVGIAIYDDRVEIENPGSFPMGWDMEKIKSKHASKPQNPLIADVLYIRKILESWGRGIGLIMSECQKANLPEPEYWTDSDEVRLIFRYQAIDHPSTGQVPDKYRTSRTAYQADW
ncbi:MAG: putative DNA binding domain-containing protein [Prevotella sp.]|nr:putative DNA binding domain-containing protein [Prevotella sp.]